MLEMVTDLDEHVFVIRARTGERMKPWQYLGTEVEIQIKRSSNRYSTSISNQRD